MRKFVLVAAMVLASATAQAGASRGLTLASGDEPAAAEQPKAAEAPKSVETPKPAEAPNYVARPAAVDATTEAPRVGQAKPGSERNSRTFRAERQRHRRPSIQARIIYALHRYGVYW
jgi:hypothetical protein